MNIIDKTQSSTVLVDKLTDIITQELADEVQTYNESFLRSQKYVKRKINIQEEDEILVILNSHKQDFEKLLSLESENSEGHDQISAQIDILNHKINDRIVNLLNSEFNLIDNIWDKIYGKYQEYVKVKLLTMDIQNSDETIETVKNYIKDKFEIYI